MTKHETAGKDSATADWYPGWPARIIIALAIVCTCIASIGDRWEDPPAPLDDPAFRNTLRICAGIGAGAALWLWFCLRSRYARRMRLPLTIGSALVLLAIGGIVFKRGVTGVIQFSGDLVPQLALDKQDVAVSLPAPAAGSADLQTTSAEDFPQFLGPARSNWLPGPQLARDWKKHPPRQLWKRPVGAGWSAFAAVNGYAVTLEQRGGEEWVLCYAIETGEPIWGHGIEARHETALGGIGPRSTPTIHNGRVYALGATGVLRCLDGNGQLVWSDDLRQRYGITASEDEQNVMFGRSASPLIVDTLVVVPGGGFQGKAKNLVAFDSETGRLVWEAECKLPSGEADQIAYSSPALATLAGRRQILIVNESTVSGHDPTSGERLWVYAWPGKSNGAASVSQVVAVDERRVLLTKGYSAGAELLEFTSDKPGAFTIDSLWKVPRVLQTKFCNVVLHEGHIFGLSEGILECASLEGGRRRWKSGRYGHGQILGVGDLLLVLSEEGELQLLELNSKKMVHLGSQPALQGKTWNNLCLYGTRLLVRNSEEAACFELPLVRSPAESVAEAVTK